MGLEVFCFWGELGEDHRSDLFDNVDEDTWDCPDRGMLRLKKHICTDILRLLRESGMVREPVFDAVPIPDPPRSPSAIDAVRSGMTPREWNRANLAASKPVWDARMENRRRAESAKCDWINSALWDSERVIPVEQVSAALKLAPETGPKDWDRLLSFMRSCLDHGGMRVEMC